MFPVAGVAPRVVYPLPRRHRATQSGLWSGKMRVKNSDEKEPLDNFMRKLGFHISILNGDPEWKASGGDLSKEIDRLGDMLDVFYEKTESPIELLLATELIFLSVGLRGKVLNFGGACMSATGLEAQAKVGDFRVDFLWTLTEGEKTERLVIECDGHDFHERTKDQAERDKSRDRDLAALGYRVLRFTGSEIWRNPTACSEEVCSHLNKALARMRGSPGEK